MAHQRKSLWSDGTAAAAVSSAAGILCSLLLLLLFSALVRFLMDSLMFMDAFSVISLAAGSFVGSFVYGKFRRRGGLIGGILCGAVMYAFLSAVAFAVNGSAMNIKKLLLLCLFGAAGGVCGVNSKRPRGLRDQ